MAMHICFSADENYIPYAAVLMTSIILNIKKEISFENLIFQSKQLLKLELELLKNFPKKDFKHLKEEEKEDKIIFHLFGDGIKEKTLEDLKEMEIFLNQHYACEIKTHILADELFHSFPKWRDNYLAYYRLLIADCLKEVDRALYLDVDMLVLKDLRILWLINLENKIGAVVKDLAHHQQSARGAHKKNQKPFVFDGFYFNSGFLLLNLKELRKQNTIQKCLEFLNLYQTYCPDQDALNYAFKNKDYFSFPIEFNFFTLFYLEEKNRPIPINFDLNQLPQDPIILHFGGAQSPWVSPFIFQNKNKEYISLKWWKIANTMPVFKKQLNQAMCEKGKSLLILKFVLENTRCFWDYLTFLFKIKKFQKKLNHLSENDLFNAVKEYNHFDLEKIKLTDEMRAKFDKIHNAGLLYRCKLPFAIWKTKKQVAQWVENQKNPRSTQNFVEKF